MKKEIQEKKEVQVKKDKTLIIGLIIIFILTLGHAVYSFYNPEALFYLSDFYQFIGYVIIYPIVFCLVVLIFYFIYHTYKKNRK